MSGATVSSRMAQSRYGSAGELLPGAPIVWDTRPEWVWHKGSHRAFGKGVQRARFNENSDAILESTSKRNNAKMAL